MEHECKQEQVISDIKCRVETLERNDREDYGSRKELELSIKMLSKSIEEQTKTNAEMSQTLSKINNNMDLMATEIQNTNNRVEKLEVQLKKNDDDNTIKIMPLVKNFVLKILFPTTALGFIIYETAKALKLIKIGE
jgi:chromosome segregation ATPase